MDLAVLTCTLADSEYYEPLHRFRDGSPALSPAGMPQRWRRSRQDIWTTWSPPRATLPEQGWKIHVSATRDRTRPVLDTVAGVCVAEDVPFKHLATEFTFLLAHHKHGVRSQSGKFCTIYPPDQDAALRMLDRLDELLGSEPGPHVLSDRRYRDSRTVHYRYGSFRPMLRVCPDGTRQRMLRDGSGALVEDACGVRFVLPDGISDPFAEARPVTPAGDGGVRIGRYRVVQALAHSNAGGAYRGVDLSGRPVFIKEARAHNGLHWDGSTAQQRLRREYGVLCELRGQAPGLAPEPLDYFREWEHEFMVTELLPGGSTFRYLSRHNPYLQGGSDVDFDGYFETCRSLVRQLATALGRLHDLGYRFGDVHPRNMLVTGDGQLRLIDFEACGPLDAPPIIIGAPGFVPERVEDWEGTKPDDYGLSAMALTMLLPVHQYAARNPAALVHLRADAGRRGPVPDDLWRLATRNFPIPDVASGSPDPLPDPDELAADPLPHLHRLMEGLGREVAATARPEDPDRIWPTIPAGYFSNTWCVAYGAAGVLHALHCAGLPVDPAATERLRREALALGADLPPGLHFGTAGIGWVLAEQGHVDEAVALVAAAGSHPAAALSATWAAGTAGIGTAHLALYAYTGDDRQLEEAIRIGESLHATADLTSLVGRRNTVGLLHGRTGVALFLHHLWRVTGDKRYLRRGATLLHADLEGAIEMPGGELGFRADEVVKRVMVYLGVGAAGLGHVMTRYVQDTDDERLIGTLPRVFAFADKQLTVEPGLYLGLAGLCFAHADHADLGGAGDLTHRGRALRAAAGLFKYAAPAPGGRLRFLGTAAMRFSTELYSGAAGILLALDRVLNGPKGQLFTLDGLGDRAGGPVPQRLAPASWSNPASAGEPDAAVRLR